MSRDEMIEVMGRAIEAKMPGEPMFTDGMRAAIARDIASAQVIRLEAAGYVVVPKEPTPEMWAAGHAAYDRVMIGSRRRVLDAELAKWTAMIAATQQEKTDG